MAKFKGEYTVADGYVGDRPQKFSISPDESFNEMSDHELTVEFERMMDEHFHQYINPEPRESSVQEFIQWVRDGQR